jgi:hypothetical protein
MYNKAPWAANFRAKNVSLIYALRSMYHWRRGWISICRIVCAVAIILSVSGSFLQSASAAEVSIRYDRKTDCVMHLQGKVMQGDVMRLRTALAATYDEYPSLVLRRLCLDSPGGSIIEGIGLLHEICRSGISTAVAPAAVCESACAIAFLGGNASAGNYMKQSRVIFPGGSLGFHAPGLVLKDGLTYAASDILRAFEVALEASDALIALLDFDNGVMRQSPMNIHLLRIILGTPSSSMFHIRDLWGAALADIEISGAEPPSMIQSDHVENLCDAAFIRNVKDRPSKNGLSDAGSLNLGSRIELYTGHAYLKEIRDMSPRGSVVSPRGSLIIDGPIVKGMVMGYNIPGSGAVACLMTWKRSDIEADVSFFRYNMFLESTILSEGLVERLSDDLKSVQVKEFDFSSKVSVSTAFFFHPLTLLSEIPQSTGGAALAYSSCWIRSPNIRITRVKEFTNLRRRPDFSAPVIRQVPLGEQVSATRADNITVIGKERDRQS